MQKDETRALSCTIHKEKLKMDERSKCETRFHQNPRGEHRQHPFCSHSNFLQDTSTKARETKAKMNYWDCLKIKAFAQHKIQVNTAKRQPSEWEKIFANDISDKGLVSKIYKELIIINSKETNNLNVKWAKDMNRNLTEEDIDMPRSMRKCSASLGVREIQINLTLRYHLTPVRMGKINTVGNNKCWRGCGERGTLMHCWWKCELVQPLWKTVWRFPKSKK